MKEKAILSSIYVLILFMIVAVALVSGLLISSLDKKVIYRDRILTNSCEPRLKIVEKTKILYKNKIIYRDRIKFKNKIIYLPVDKEIKYGFSLVGGSFNSTIKEYSLGLGFKIRYKNIYSQLEMLENKSVLLSLGYEF